jgi:DNA-binding transcriptional ArsR family regulator
VDAYQSAQLDALGDATRRAILSRLATEGPLAVGELARDFPMSRPAISQHLRVLKDANLVTDRTAGTQRLYAVNPEAIASLRTYFEGFWLQALAAFKRTVEAEIKDHREKGRAQRPRHKETK